MKTLCKVWLLLALLAQLSSADLNTPKNILAAGSVTAAGQVCALSTQGANGYAVVLDGQAVATSTITVAIQVLDPVTGNYSTPVTIGGVTQPITLTNATTQVLSIPGSFPGIQVNVTSFGTATGTFSAYISAY